MHRIALGLLAAVALLAATTGPGEAQNRRWCTERGVGSWGFPNCAYDSYAQCDATARGLGVHCTTNPWYARGSTQPRKSRRYRSRD
jgi:hypothetical protein